MATNRVRLLPDFLIIGGQRCGTSSLNYYLTEYPGIISASTKETHFFDEEFGKGTGWYRAQFPTFFIKTMSEKYISESSAQEKERPTTFYILMHPGELRNYSQRKAYCSIEKSSSKSLFSVLDRDEGEI
jgi:hypothetical protein